MHNDNCFNRIKFLLYIDIDKIWQSAKSWIYFLFRFHSKIIRRWWHITNCWSTISQQRDLTETNQPWPACCLSYKQIKIIGMMIMIAVFSSQLYFHTIIAKCHVSWSLLILISSFVWFRTVIRSCLKWFISTHQLHNGGPLRRSRALLSNQYFPMPGKNTGPPWFRA